MYNKHTKGLEEQIKALSTKNKDLQDELEQTEEHYLTLMDSKDDELDDKDFIISKKDFEIMVLQLCLSAAIVVWISILIIKV